MSLKVSQLIANGGPAGSGAAWADAGQALDIAAFTASTVLTTLLIQMVAQPDKQLATGEGADFFNPAATIGRSIQRLNGAQLAVTSTLAASALLSLGLAVYRNFGPLSAQIAAADGARTTIPVSSVNTALPSGQTFVLTNAAGTAQTWTTTSAVAVSATPVSIPVSSQTPSATYAAGVPAVGIVGNGLCFGWLNSVAGTPLLVAHLPILLPALASNTALYTPANPGGAVSYLPLQPGDGIELQAITSSSTVSFPAGGIETQVI